MTFQIKIPYEFYSRIDLVNGRGLPHFESERKRYVVEPV